MGHFGIDFGTTNTTAVEIDELGLVYKYGDETGRPLPSILVVDKITGKVKCGRDVWEHQAQYLSQPHQFQ